MRRAAWSVLLLLASGPLLAAVDGAEQLARIGHAVRNLNYSGTIVYQEGEAMQSIRIVHQLVDGREQEYLQSLDGSAQEVMREGDRVVCLLGQDGPALIGHRDGSGDFPSRWAALPDDLSRSYDLYVGERGRVAGREARLLRIDSRDDLRYDHRIWFDEASGLPLRTELVGSGDVPLEVILFTDLQLWPDSDPARLADVLGRARTVLDAMETSAPVPMPPTWQVRELPEGFTLIATRRESMPGIESQVEHLVYSDGLATVSVYVEIPATSAMTGGRMIGAMSTFAQHDGNRQVVVIGDVPMETARRIGESVAPK